MITYRPQIAAAIIIIAIFGTAIVLAMVEAADRRAMQLVLRRDVKLHLCDSPRAKDANIRQALIDRLGPQGTKKNPGPTYGMKSHLWAALAVALYAHDHIVKEI